jgi:hypothetical protein
MAHPGVWIKVQKYNENFPNFYSEPMIIGTATASTTTTTTTTTSSSSTTSYLLPFLLQFVYKPKTHPSSVSIGFKI